MNFDIGEIPKGWKRGDALRHIPRPGHIPHGRAALVHIGKPLGSLDEIPEIGAVTFTKEMEPKVRAWLEWWQGKETASAVDSRTAPKGTTSP